MKKHNLLFLSFFVVFYQNSIFCTKAPSLSFEDKEGIKETLNYIRSPEFHQETEDLQKEAQAFLKSDEFKEALNAKNKEKQEWIEWNAHAFVKSDGRPSFCIHRAEAIWATLIVSSWILDYYLYKIMMSEIVKLETKHMINYSDDIYASLLRLKKIKKSKTQTLAQERTTLQRLLTRPYGWILPAKPSMKMFRAFFFYCFSQWMIETIRSSLKIDDYFFHAFFYPNNEVSIASILGFLGTMSWVSEKAMLFFGFSPQWSYGQTFYAIRWISGFLFWIRNYEAKLVASYMIPMQEKEINRLKDLLEPFVKKDLNNVSKKALHHKASRIALEDFVKATIHPSFAGWEFSKTFNMTIINTLFDVGALFTCYKQYQNVYQAMHDMGETMKPKQSTQP